MRGHHLVDLLVSYPHLPSNLQECVCMCWGGSGNETIDLLYSSKFSWHNNFVNFVIKFYSRNLKFERGLRVGLHVYSVLAKKRKF